MIKMKPCEYHKIFSSIQPDTVKMSSEVPITEMDALDEYITEQSDVMEKVYVNDKPFIHFKNGLAYGQDIYVCDMRNNLRSLVESSIVVRQKKYKLPEYLKKVGYDYGTKIPEEVMESVEPTQEQTEEPITEAKSVKLGRQKFKPMSIKQLQHAADRLMKSQDANVVRYGQTLKESADEGFSDVMKYLSNVNLILFIGGESLATCMPYIVSSILIIKQDNPEMMVIPELKKQRSIIKSKLKPKDDNLRLYTEFITQVIDDDLKYTRESVEISEEFYPLFESDDVDDDYEDEDYDDKEDEKDDDDKDDPDDEDRDHDDDDDDNTDDIHDDDDDRESVTEAKKKDDEEEDPENTDDTDDEDGDTSEEPEEEPQGEEPEEPEEDEPYNEDFGDEGPTDYTEEVEDDEPEPDEEEPEKEEKPKPLRKIRYNEDFGKNGPKDYTEDIEDDEEEPTEEEPETPEEPEEEPPTDETPEEDNTQEDNEIPEEEPQDEEPDTYNEDFGEDGPTDYTADADVDEPEEEPQDTTPEEPNTTEDTTQPDNTNQDVDTAQNTDTTENQPQEDNNLDNNEEPQQDDNGLEDGPTDYDAEAGVDTGDTDTTTDDGGDTTGDTNEEGGDAGEDTTADPNGETPTDDSNGNDRDIAVKNYNIRLKFKKLVESISDILQNLSIVVYHNPIQNQVLERGIENIQSIKEQIISYMEFNLSSDYKTNLYYYTTFIQALQLNLDMLTKNSQMSMEDTKNNK